ncbi:putative uncharacterized protein DDB_G0294196 [Octopus bimaculoides]|uniref:putative uncharacterized protein DDB_G0294196 n=1 Tax=Octopus bimaculoides TaxID=37653 RepID=UPI00071CA46F|nr:putative uncharacterized protein DDB_G0294196 [Octopus bimaculoides]|eukprot:XP_014784955.1 PREDICTED: putative uncharacterized protein DDB_G0294196 [Octopus bimaculoides]
MARRGPKQKLKIVDQVLTDAEIRDEKWTLNSLSKSIGDPGSLDILEWLAKRRLIRNTYTCTTCNIPCGVNKYTGCEDKYRWYCSRCKNRKSIRTDSVFDKSKLDLSQLVIFIYSWTKDMLLQDTVAKASSDWAQLCKDEGIRFIGQLPIQSDDMDLKNGTSVVVKIDKTHFSSRKYNRGDGSPPVGSLEASDTKTPKTKRSPAKPEPESYTSVAKKRRTKDDFYTFCTIVLSYTQYESLKREELRQQNNISPVGSGGSAADSYSSDSTASLSSGSLQESIPETLQENLPIDRVQENITSTLTTTTTTTTTTSTVVNCRLSERITHQQTTPKQQFLKQQPPKHPMFLKQQQQQQQPQHIKQHSKLQLLKQQQQQQQQQHTKQLVQPKQQLVPRQLTKPQNQATLVQATVLPSLSSIPQQNSNRLDGFYHRNVEADLSSLSSSSSSSPSSSSHQQYSSHQKQKLHQQVLVDDKVKQLEGVQLQKREECTPCEHHLKTHIKQEEKPSLDELQSNSVVSQNSVTSVKVEKEVFEPVVEEKKANTHFSKLDLHAHENNTDSLAESCGESIHSNSSSPDAIESDDESWDLITCHCLKPYAGRPMIECSECSTWIHLSCAKIRKSNIPETFVCQQCREAKFTTRKSNRIRTESKRISI